MTQNIPNLPLGKPIGFKTLQEISGYISIHDGNVLAIKVNVMKVQKTDQKDQQGMPLYNIASALNFAVMSKPEYDAMVKNELID